jgi:N-acetylglucosamine-6-phosphate deacetylase
MKKATENVCIAKKSGKSKANIIGAHLEGPYLSVKQCGAQCTDFITPPVKEDYQALIKEFGDGVARWTYAPELDIDGEFCKYLTERGINVSAGHTDAVYQDMQTAIDSGCNLITHLYSCTSTVTRKNGFRSLGVIESAYLRDELSVEIIADGKHLPPDLIKMIIKIKGEDKVILITDSLEIAGTSIKEGVMSGTEFIVEDGVCKLKDRTAFAGSVATADCLIRTLVNDCGFSILTAVKMLTKTPADLLKLNKGDLVSGKDADVIVFDDGIKVSSVFVGGKKVK